MSGRLAGLQASVGPAERWASGGPVNLLMSRMPENLQTPGTLILTDLIKQR